jgi:hypothetical protein
MKDHCNFWRFLFLFQILTWYLVVNIKKRRRKHKSGGSRCQRYDFFEEIEALLFPFIINQVGSLQSPASAQSQHQRRILMHLFI